MRTAPLAALFLLSACSGLSGPFPSLAPRPGENPRIIAAPGAGQEASLADEERARITADIDAESKELEKIERAIAEAGAALDQALAAARGAAPGSSPWADAHLALSRFDVARGPLDELEARLSPMLRMVDSLPASSPDRQAVESLGAAIASVSARARAKADAARRQLGN